MSKRENAEEDYITTPISVLRYITELESQLAELRQEKKQVLRRVEEIYEDLISGEGITECLEELQEQLKEKGE